MLQYSSAFDDEVVEVPEDTVVELPHVPESILECVPEEIPEVIIDEGAPEPPPDEEGSAMQAEPSHPPTSVVHGPYYYFYQGGVTSAQQLWGNVVKRSINSSLLLPSAEDCQQMFLHPVNVRCLLREYGSLEASPDSITATVVEIVGHTVTEVRLHTSQ